MNRMRIATTVWLVSISVAAMCGQGSNEPTLRSWVSPRYPVLARNAGIQGNVKIEFALNESGETIKVRIVSGHPLLAKAALDAVNTWRFTAPSGGFEPDRKYEATVEFVFSGIASQLKDTVAEVSVESRPFLTVRVATPRQGETQAEKCPAAEVVAPPSHARQEDFVELSRSGCYGSCPVYTVRVYRDGRVEWHGVRFVKATGDRRGKADPALVSQVIEQFRTERYWSLCGLYSRSVTDSATVSLTANIGGEEKVVVDYAWSGPPWLRDLVRAVDDVANFHLWLTKRSGRRADQ
jgi:TonB family protein